MSVESIDAIVAAIRWELRQSRVRQPDDPGPGSTTFEAELRGKLYRALHALRDDTPEPYRYGASPPSDPGPRCGFG